MIEQVKINYQRKNSGIAIEDCFGRKLTWEDLYLKSNCIANCILKSQNLRKEPIAICLDNCVEWFVIFLGVIKAGSIAVPINPNHTEKDMRHAILSTGCKCIFFNEQFEDKIRVVCENTNHDIKLFSLGNSNLPNNISVGQVLDNYSVEEPYVQIFPEDVVCIYFSSGTTGASKPVCISLRSLTVAGKIEVKHHLQNETDYFACVAPLYHMGALCHWLGSFFSCSSTLLYTYSTPDKLLETISKKRITIVWLLLPWVQDIIDAVETNYINVSNYNFDSWRLMHMGAQPIPEEVVIKWRRLFPNQQFDISYGLTESGGPGCIHIGIGKEFKRQMLGYPDDEWEVCIKNNFSLTQHPNIEGEILVRGPGLMKGYYNDESSTKAVLSDEGWLYTGDIGMFDENGIVYFTGRKKDIIIVGGENIYPLEIENHIKEVSWVKDVAVIGIPHKRLGEVVGAVIEPSQNIDVNFVKKVVKKHCRSLPAYMQPLSFFFDVVPRNSTGKIDKKVLCLKYIMKSGDEYNG